MVGVRVLVVEDERLLADAITAGLRNHAMAVDVAYDGDAALERLAVNDYDVVVLDRDLPCVSGVQVCATLVESGSDTRILMLTAATAVSQRVAGLGLGADDYLTKPFDFAELIARIHALKGIRRPHRTPARRRRRGLRGAPSGKGMGRTHRSLHWRRPVHHHDGAPQAGRPADHRNRPRRRIPNSMTRRWHSTIRVRLTLLYAGALFLAGAVLITVMYIYFGQSLNQHVTRRAAITEQLTADFLDDADAHSSPKVDQLHEALKGQFQQDRDDTLRATLVWSLASLGVVGLAAGGLG
jgi:CheY-like chemotaxis protein